ncbi:hypothetical protein HK104_010968 [Borealophlyctis nickersoniae]|nr:hypothetical protein HK104_010968 [Borealophlyctis nickersoniae]
MEEDASKRPTLPTDPETVLALKRTGLFDSLRQGLLEDYQTSAPGLRLAERLKNGLATHRSLISTNPVFLAAAANRATLSASGALPGSAGLLEDAAVKAESAKILTALARTVDSSDVFAGFAKNAQTAEFLRCEPNLLRMRDAVQAIYDRERGNANAPNQVKAKLDRRSVPKSITGSSDSPKATVKTETESANVAGSVSQPLIHEVRILSLPSKDDKKEELKKTDVDSSKETNLADSRGMVQKEKSVASRRSESEESPLNIGRTSPTKEERSKVNKPPARPNSLRAAESEEATERKPASDGKRKAPFAEPTHTKKAEKDQSGSTGPEDGDKANQPSEMESKGGMKAKNRDASKEEREPLHDSTGKSQEMQDRRKESGVKDLAILGSNGKATEETESRASAGRDEGLEQNDQRDKVTQEGGKAKMYLESKHQIRGRETSSPFRAEDYPDLCALEAGEEFDRVMQELEAKDDSLEHRGINATAADKNKSTKAARRESQDGTTKSQKDGEQNNPKRKSVPQDGGESSQRKKDQGKKNGEDVRQKLTDRGLDRKREEESKGQQLDRGRKEDRLDKTKQKSSGDISRASEKRKRSPEQKRDMKRASAGENGDTTRKKSRAKHDEEPSSKRLKRSGDNRAEAAARKRSVTYTSESDQADNPRLKPVKKRSEPPPKEDRTSQAPGAKRKRERAPADNSDNSPPPRPNSTAAKSKSKEIDKRQSSAKRRAVFSSSSSDSGSDRDQRDRTTRRGSDAGRGKLKAEEGRKKSVPGESGKRKASDASEKVEAELFPPGKTVAAFVKVVVPASGSDSEQEPVEKETCYIVEIEKYNPTTRLYTVRDPDPDPDDDTVPDVWKVPAHKIVDFRKNSITRPFAAGDKVYSLHRANPEDEPSTEFYKATVVRVNERHVAVRYVDGDTAIMKYNELFRIADIPQQTKLKDRAPPQPTRKSSSPPTPPRRTSLASGTTLPRRGSTSAPSPPSSPTSTLSSVGTTPAESRATSPDALPKRRPAAVASSSGSDSDTKSASPSPRKPLNRRSSKGGSPRRRRSRSLSSASASPPPRSSRRPRSQSKSPAPSSGRRGSGGSSRRGGGGGGGGGKSKSGRRRASSSESDREGSNDDSSRSVSSEEEKEGESSD